ncbi:MAG: tetratricopeptide repeat protein [Spirochaetes bacterium]|nr:tetratricopeptide repeat protein [Spirochaetota bacterium]
MLNGETIRDAEKYFQNGNYKKAIVLYQDLLKNNDKFLINKFESAEELEAFCNFMIGRCYYYQGHFAPAVKIFSGVINNHSSSTVVHKALFWKASTYYHLKKDYNKALKYFKQYSEKYKDRTLYIRSLFCMVNCYNKLHQKNNAKNILVQIKNLKDLSKENRRQADFELKKLNN